MYKNVKYEVEACQGYGPEGAMGLILKYLLGTRKGKEDSKVTKKNFEGSHTYLWLQEARSYALRNYGLILEVYYAEEKEGLIGFVNKLLELNRGMFDIPPED